MQYVEHYYVLCVHKWSHSIPNTCAAVCLCPNVADRCLASNDVKPQTNYLYNITYNILFNAFLCLCVWAHTIVPMQSKIASTSPQFLATVAMHPHILSSTLSRLLIRAPSSSSSSSYARCCYCKQIYAKHFSHQTYAWKRSWAWNPLTNKLLRFWSSLLGYITSLGTLCVSHNKQQTHVVTKESSR